VLVSRGRRGPIGREPVVTSRTIYPCAVVKSTEVEVELSSGVLTYLSKVQSRLIAIY